MAPRSRARSRSSALIDRIAPDISWTSSAVRSTSLAWATSIKAPTAAISPSSPAALETLNSAAPSVTSLAASMATSRLALARPLAASSSSMPRVEVLLRGSLELLAQGLGLGLSHLFACCRSALARAFAFSAIVFSPLLPEFTDHGTMSMVASLSRVHSRVQRLRSPLGG